MYDLQNFSHVPIYVGGNNASNKTDIEYLEERYDQLICYIKEKSKETKILLVNSCPRGDADTSKMNDIISSLTDQHEVELVDAHKAFFNKRNEIIQKYYSGDKIHLSNSGVKCLVGTISKQLDIADNYSNCFFAAAKQITGRHKQSSWP